MKTKLTYIPDNYYEILNELKDKHFCWETNFCSRTENRTIGHITHYSIDNSPAQNCLILIPGLASNTRTEPLMKVVEYWALTHRHDVYCLDTFLGDFLPFVSQELAEKHTFDEFINLVDTGMDIIEKDVKSKNYRHSCLIGHSAGAIGAFEIYNRRIRERKKLRFSASVMFAPHIEHSFTVYIQNFFKKFTFKNNINEEISLYYLKFPKNVSNAKNQKQELLELYNNSSFKSEKPADQSEQTFLIELINKHRLNVN